MCKKISHRNTHQAIQHALGMKIVKNRKSDKYGIYKCDECGLYHLTSHYSWSKNILIV